RQNLLLPRSKRLVVYLFEGGDEPRIDATHLPVAVHHLDEGDALFDGADDCFLQFLKRCINHECRAVAQPDPYCHLLPVARGSGEGAKTPKRSLPPGRPILPIVAPNPPTRARLRDASGRASRSGASAVPPR